MASSAQVVGASLLAWIIWRIARKLTAKSPLDNLAGPPAKSWLRGNFVDLVGPDGWEVHSQLAKKYGGVLRLQFLFGTPMVYVFDPKSLHHILVKDNYSYDQPEGFLIANEVVFGKGLLATGGDHHRKQRKLLNPVFSMGHMRKMVPTFYRVITKLQETIEGQVQDGPQEVDISHWMTRTALELIGQSGLGYSFDPLTVGGEAHPFSIAVKDFGAAFKKLSFWRAAVLPIVSKWGSPRFQRAVVDTLSSFWGALRRGRDIVDVMTQTSITIYEEKKKALAKGSDVGGGNDLISILMRENLEASDEDKMPVEEVLGQMTSFTFAAMDTTSNALCRIFDLLSRNPEAQERLRQEIRDATEKYGAQLEYDALMGLPYLDAVIRETLRLYPPVPALLRDTKCDMVLPISKPVIGVDGRQLNEVVIPKGTKILLGIVSANRNPDLWGPDVFEWKPERWLAPLPEALVKTKVPGVYSHLMTFLAGGRACIGFKFSELEMKVALCVLLEKMKFTPLDKKILWRMNGIVQPTVQEPGYDQEKTQLPIRIEKVD